MKKYKEVVLNPNKNTEEVLIHVDGYKVIVKTISVGEYGFGKKVTLSILNSDLTYSFNTPIGYSKAKIGWDEIKCKHELTKEGCLCMEIKPFDDLKQIALEYFVKVINELKNLV